MIKISHIIFFIKKLQTISGGSPPLLEKYLIHTSLHPHELSEMTAFKI